MKKINFKINNKENKLLTTEELEKYTNRLNEIKDLFIIAMNNKDYSSMQKYGKELKEIKKILVKANKVAKENVKWVLC